MNQEAPVHPNSISNLLRQLRDVSTTLIRQEVSLAKAELKESVGQVERHITQIAVGAMMAFAGLVVLCLGMGHLASALLIKAGVNEEVAGWVGPLSIGLLVIIAGGLLLERAKRKIANNDDT